MIERLTSLFAPVKVSHVHRTDTRSSLTAIASPGVNLAVWQRVPSPDLHRAVTALLLTNFKSITKKINLHDDVGRQVQEALPNFLIEPTSALLEDVENHCRQFAALCEADLITLHLKTVTNDSCRKFHIDGYALRLLCTYAGPGTEWTYNDNVNRKQLGAGENETIIKDWSRIEKLNPFDVAVLKGEPPHRRTGVGIVHRSPPIEQNGEKRLLLRLDC